MSNKHTYDFTGLEQDEQNDENPRPNYRVTRCCGNCKHYFYRGAKSRRGYCRLPNPKEKAVNKSKGEKYDLEEIKKTWDKTHTTALCDEHLFRSKYYSVGIVSEWTGVLFAFDGTMIEEDDDL